MNGEELERFRLLGRVFRELPQEFAGLKLAPLTAGRWSLLRERENAFLFGDAPEGQEDAPEGQEYDPEEEKAMIYATAEFLWVHVAPVPEVIRADRAGEQAWEEAVWQFAIEHCEFSALTEFAVSFAERAQELAAAVVDLEDDEEEGQEPGKTQTRRSGLRVMCSPSEDTKAGSGGTGSCGDSPTRKGSNISTAPTTDPEAAAGGPWPSMEPIPKV